MTAEPKATLEKILSLLGFQIDNRQHRFVQDRVDGVPWEDFHLGVGVKGKCQVRFPNDGDG